MVEEVAIVEVKVEGEQNSSTSLRRTFTCTCSGFNTSNLRKIETFRQAFKRQKQWFHEQALVPELKLSFEQVSQEVMVVEGIGTSSVYPRVTSVDFSTRMNIIRLVGETPSLWIEAFNFIYNSCMPYLFFHLAIRPSLLPSAVGSRTETGSNWKKGDLGTRGGHASLAGYRFLLLRAHGVPIGISHFVTGATMD